MASCVNMPKNRGMNIGSVIREIRQAKGLTLEEVAYAAGTDGGNLSRIERGLQRCIPELLEQIAVSLNLPVSELYLRAESGRADAKKDIQKIKAIYAVPPMSPEDAQQTAFLGRYKKLNETNQALVADFIQMLLRHQRQK